MDVIRDIAGLDALPNGSVIVGVDPQQTTRFKSSDQWIDQSKPVGTTWSLNTYILARRWGVQAVYVPERGPLQ